ncbi:MAG: restriction endonuclease subunit M [Planctomycetaceae bacterium]|nr:MAG: restriction endonuclease subunit M [Planctomycetaceae bacterium]
MARKKSVSSSVQAGKPSCLIDTRVVYCGDNIDQLRRLPDACVDLIYIDPPFNSNRNYEVFWGENKEKRAFEDRHASTQAYIDYMRPRCMELARVLKKTGSFYYHCDWHASHYVKVMLDQIFGENQFVNEIIWKRYGAHNDVGQGSKHYGRATDTILFYNGGSPKYTWHQLFMPLDPDYVEETYRHVDEETGRHFTTTPLTGPGGEAKGNPVFEWNGHTRAWRISKGTMQKLHKSGELHYSKTGYVRRKLFLDESRGIPVQNLWTDIKALTGSNAERLGYPTQKPLALLERIIKASSNPNDIVLDAFCGCGTALVAAENLGRQWIGIDISPTACRVMAKRLRDICHVREDENLWRNGRGFVVRDLPWTEEKLRAIPPFEFENWAVIALGGTPNKAQVGDMGIDGRIYLVNAMPSNTGEAAGELAFMDEWYPVQVKQKDKAGRMDIDAFEAAMIRAKRKKGFFVAFDYTRDAMAECQAFFVREHRIIVPLTVKEILEERIAHKLT